LAALVSAHQSAPNATSCGDNTFISRHRGSEILFIAAGKIHAQVDEPYCRRQFLIKLVFRAGVRPAGRLMRNLRRIRFAPYS
jgi:hypothetical protein